MMNLGTNQQLAYLVLRFTLGINLFFHGIVRFGDSYGAFVNDTVTAFSKEPVPTFVVQAVCYLLPLAEFVIGAMLTLGIKTRFAALAGSLVMIILISGMVMLEEWDVVGVQMVYVLFYTAVIAFLEHNFFSVDQKFWNKKA